MSTYASFGTEWYAINTLWLITTLATVLAAILLAFICTNYFNNNNNNNNNNHKNKNKNNNESNNKCSINNEHENQSWLDGLFKFKNNLRYAICRRLKVVKQCNSSLPDALNDTGGNTVAESDAYAEDLDSGTLDDAIDDNIDRIHIEGLVSKLKIQKLKQIKAQFTKCQLEEEKKIEREQLAAIFELLKQQELALNVKEIDKHELNAQLRLYR